MPTATAAILLSLSKKRLQITGAGTTGGGGVASAARRAPARRTAAKSESRKAAPAKAAAPKRVARKADAATVARYDAKLKELIAAALADDAQPQFLLASLNSEVRILAINDAGILSIETLDPPMQFNIDWAMLGFDVKRSLALGMLRKGNAEDQALVAFYASAGGD